MGRFREVLVSAALITAISLSSVPNGFGRTKIDVPEPARAIATERVQNIPAQKIPKLERILEKPAEVQRTGEIGAGVETVALENVRAAPVSAQNTVRMEREMRAEIESGGSENAKSGIDGTEGTITKFAAWHSGYAHRYNKWYRIYKIKKRVLDVVEHLRRLMEKRGQIKTTQPVLQKTA